MSRSRKAAGAKAGVVDGPGIDIGEIKASELPVWCRSLTPITTRVHDLGRN